MINISKLSIQYTFWQIAFASIVVRNWSCGMICVLQKDMHFINSMKYFSIKEYSY
jgi:hypothetical protein